MVEVETAIEQDWRDDPGWRLVKCAPGRFDEKPTADAELRRNPVVDILHMSGECLCGSFARPGERDEIRLWFPKTDARIGELEVRVAAAGHHAYIWGQRPPNVAREQMSLLPPLLPGPLCSEGVST